MAEYIEREAAIGLLHYHADEACSAVVADVEVIPAADVAPVKHGQWKRSGPLIECGQCGEIYSRLGGNAGKAWNYCPNCGAKMDEKP